MKKIEQHAFELCGNDIDKLNFIMQKTRRPEVTIIRFRVMYELRELGFTFNAIAEFFKYSGHQPVRNGIRIAKEQIEFENRIKKHVKL